MNININNCRENLDKSMEKINSILSPLQVENSDIVEALVHSRYLWIEAKTILDEYEKLKNN